MYCVGISLLDQKEISAVISLSQMTLTVVYGVHTKWPL